MHEMWVHSVILAEEIEDYDPRLLATFTAEIGDISMKPCRLHLTMAARVVASLPGLRDRSGSIRFNDRTMRRKFTEIAVTAFLDRGGVLPKGAIRG